MNVGAYLTRLIASYGCDTVFGIPGVHTVELYRDFAASGLRHVTGRHEQSLGFMADGYARASGRPAVCFVITGPGLTNISTAMAQAYADSVPMLVISAVNAVGRMGSGNGYLHELPNQSQLGSSVAAFSHSILDPRELPQVLARAFAVFDGGRPRPVHIEVPMDVLAASAEDLPPVAPVRRLQAPAAHPDLVAEAAGLLARANRPVLLVGGGASAEAAAITHLAERLAAPVLMTANGRGILPAGHPLDVSFSASLAPVRALIERADVVLAIGTELGPTDYDAYDDQGFRIPGKLIRIEIDPQHMMRTRNPDVPLLGAAGPTLAALHAALPELQPKTEEAAILAQGTRLAARESLGADMRRELSFLEELREDRPAAIIVGDSTQQVYAGNLGYAARGPRRWFNAATGFGALGYGLPAAIGAAIARPEQEVVCLAGDGGLQFTLSELGTAIEEGVRISLILLNNSGYGEIKRSMQAVAVAPLGVDLHTPDFLAIAKAYGWRAERFTDRSDLLDALREDGQTDIPCIYELNIEG